jgi:F-type H+-transporting ATPase subunit a
VEEHHYYYINEILGALGFSHFAHEYQQVTHSLFVMIIMIAGGFFLSRGLKFIPDKGQSFLEYVVSSLEDFMVDITGPEGRIFFPFIATLFLYILLCNLIGLVPGFFSPTADPNTTLSLALCTFVLTHIIGIKFHGIKYVKHFMGPVWYMAWIMFPIEVISHFARILSLTFRLFGNIFGKEKVLGIFFVLGGFYLLPLPILFLGILVSFIQATVFLLLATIYFAGAMEEAH